MNGWDSPWALWRRVPESPAGGQSRAKTDGLSRFTQKVVDEGARFLRVGAAFDNANASRYYRSQRRIGKLHRLAAGDGRQAKEVDDHADAVLAADDRFGDAEAAFGDAAHVAAGVEQQRPAFVPAIGLQDGLDRQMGGAAARRRADDEMIVVSRGSDRSTLWAAAVCGL